MRLWHKSLICVLPRKQLLSQWRECCCIAKNISVNGTPNHILVNKIIKYPMSHFYTYGLMVASIMDSRGYKCDVGKFTHYFTYPHETNFVDTSSLFNGWHNERYRLQCYYNLQEKYDCGGISKKEWTLIEERMISCGKEI